MQVLFILRALGLISRREKGKDECFLELALGIRENSVPFAEDGNSV